MLFVDAPEVLEEEVFEVSAIGTEPEPVSPIIFGTCEKCGKKCFTGEGGPMLCAEHTFELIHKEDFESGRRITKEGPARGIPLL